ncbi:MAG: HAD-IB family phosphatase [Akkermansia sp.]|nr:HAD-IB family phosphatase [Akkermansia sp.]
MIALFDMDGTLFPGDSQLRFAAHILSRRPWRRLYLFFLLPFALMALLRLCSPALMKRAFLAYLWRMKRTEIEREAELFAEGGLVPVLYPETLARLKRHQERNDLCILVSASPDFYTEALGRHLGFNAAIATPFEWGERMPLLPPIVPPGNNKGANKALRLRASGLVPREGLIPDSVGYTDSRADLPMLALCGHAVLVNPSPALEASLGTKAEVLRPELPWKSKWGHLRFIVRCILGLRLH